MEDLKKYIVNKDDNVSTSFYSELMSNYFPESTVQAGKEIRTLMIGEERPIIFYQDKEDKLVALLRKEGSASGWITISLSKNKVKSFELEYNQESDQFQIAKVEDNQVWVSQVLPLGSTDFEALGSLISWKGLTPDTYSEQVDKVSIGTEHVLFATSEAGKDALFYLASLEDLEPHKYTLPENAKNIISFELGNFLFTNGVFLLYKIGKSKGMLYQSFPDPIYHKVEQRRFEISESINCFSLLEGEDGNDVLFAAGTQVHQLAMLEDGSDFEVITLPGKLGEIQKIRSASYDHEKTVWALDERGLHYQTNRFFDQKEQVFIPGKWTNPLLMVDKAEQFSCVKGRGVRNQLYSISTAHGSELTRLWQDNVTTMWNQHKITVEASESLKEVESYSAHIRFNTADSSRLFRGQHVMISADTNLFVYINSKSYHLGPDHEVAFPLGMIPEFTIICPVRDIASSRIFLKADFLREDVAINLAGKVLERLQSRMDEGGLAKAQLPNGKNLVANGVDADAIRGAEAGISQMLSAVRDMENNESPGIKSPSFVLDAATSTVSSLKSYGTSGFWAEAGHTLGDFLHSIWDKAKEAFHFVVEKVSEGLKFIVKIGEQVFNWVVKTVKEIGGFIQKIFDAIGVFFKDLFEFLAFLFDWDSILATKKALKGFTNNAIAGLTKEVASIRKFINDTLDAEIAKFTPELSGIPDKLANANVSHSPKETKADPRSNWMSSKKDYLQSGERKTLKDTMPTDFASVFEKLISELQEIFKETGEGFVKVFTALGEDFSQVIHGKMSFLDFLKSAMNKLAGMGLFLVKQLMNVVLSALESLLEVAYVGLNMEWQIPLISELYKEVSGGDKLTFLDVMCLFVAIPTTILYKIGEGKAPFSSENIREAFVKSGEKVFQLNLN